MLQKVERRKRWYNYMFVDSDINKKLRTEYNVDRDGCLITSN